MHLSPAFSTCLCTVTCTASFFHPPQTRIGRSACSNGGPADGAACFSKASLDPAYARDRAEVDCLLLDFFFGRPVRVITLRLAMRVKTEHLRAVGFADAATDTLFLVHLWFPCHGFSPFTDPDGNQSARRTPGAPLAVRLTDTKSAGIGFYPMRSVPGPLRPAMAHRLPLYPR
jgi:hypothetical protein